MGTGNVATGKWALGMHTAKARHRWALVNKHLQMGSSKYTWRSRKDYNAIRYHTKESKIMGYSKEKKKTEETKQIILLKLIEFNPEG